MSSNIIKGTPELAAKIREHRKVLNLTIEEAANRAQVGVKTWYRYEAGESIREDKYKNICRLLGLNEFRNQVNSTEDSSYTVDASHEAWSPYLAKVFGEKAAIAFADGYDILSDDIEEDLSALAKMPRGSHIGQLDTLSCLRDLLPQQFLTQYDYEFVFKLLSIVNKLRLHLHHKNVNDTLYFSTVIEELAFYMIVNEGQPFDQEPDTEWIYEIFADDDLHLFLYNENLYLQEEDTYHFDNWFKPQFWCERKEQDKD